MSVCFSWCLTSVTVFQSKHTIFLYVFLSMYKYIILFSVLYFCVGKFTRGEGENTGIYKEKELLAVVVNHFLQELRNTYLSTVLEQVSVQV
jgi:hypothetical protein